MKRLCILLPMHWSAAIGGAEMQVRTLVEELVRRRRFDLYYLTRSSSEDYRPQGYTVVRVRSRRAVGGTFVLEAPDILRKLHEIRPDVIYQRVASAYTGVGAWYATHNDARMIWHVANDRDLAPVTATLSPRSPFEFINRRMIDYGVRNATRIVVQNQEQDALLRQRYGRTDAIRIPNFHRPPDETAVKSAAPLIICWIANIKPHKHPELFLELARRFDNRSDLRFVMIGAQQVHGRAWSQFTARLAAVPNVDYLGSQTPAEAEGLLARASILVNTSETEGFPNTFIQAWLRHTVVVSFDVNPDGLLNADRLGLYASRSLDALTDAVKRLIDNPALRDELGKRAADFAATEYSHLNVDRLIQVLDPVRS